MDNYFGAEPDYLSLSFLADRDGYIEGHTSDELLEHLRFVLADSGLVGIALSPLGHGRFAYSQCLNILRPSHETDKPTMAGIICYTPQHEFHASRFNAGLMFQLSGAGCAGVDFPKLFDHLKEFQPRITRLDLCIDYLQGEVSFEKILQLYHAGNFVSGGRPPRISTIRPRSQDGQKVGGYTVYIGKRGGNKFFRAYEKYYQLASVGVDDSPFSKWFRVEVEARATDCDIPLNAINNYDAFLMGMYPKFFSKIPPPSHILAGMRTPDITKLHWHHPAAQVSLEHLQHHAKQSYGGLFNVLRNHLKLSDSQILDKVTHQDVRKVPSRLVIPTTELSQ